MRENPDWEAVDAAPGGVAQASYADRPNVLGRINPGGAPSLLLNGHVDVVPAESGRWAGDPFIPVRADGWLTGRGGGDMKGGFAPAAIRPSTTCPGPATSTSAR